MLKHASVVISFALAVFYALGITQHQGFLSELGLRETQFPLSPDRIFFQGFFSLAIMNAEAMNYQAIAAAACAGLAVLLFMFGGFLFKSGPKKPTAKDIINSAEPPKHHQAADFLLRIAMIIVWAFIIFVAIVVVLRVSEASGEKSATNFRDRTLFGQEELREIKLRKNAVCLHGFPIICNSSQCAYLIGGESTVISHSEVEWVQSVGRYQAAVDNPDDPEATENTELLKTDCKLDSFAYRVPTS